MALTAAQVEWIMRPSAERVATIELPAWNGLPAVYLSTAFYLPGYNSSQAGVQYDARINGSISITRRATGALLGGGQSQSSLSPIVVNNGDNQLAAWFYQNWEDRPFILRWGDPAWLEPTDHITVIQGRVTDLEPDGASARIIARDDLAVLDDPYPTAVYTAAESPHEPGALKPITHGDVRRAEPVLLDEVDLDMGVSGNGGTPINLYDNGVLLTPPPSVNEDWQDLGGGVIRLTGPPIGQITCDSQGPTWPDASVQAVIKAVLMERGIDPAQIDDAGLASMTAGEQRDVGLYLRDKRTGRIVVDMLAQSVGGIVFQDRSGMITGRQIAVPTGAPDLVVDEHCIQGGVSVRRVTRGSNGVRLLVRSGWTSQPMAALTAVSFSERSSLSQLFTPQTAGTADENTQDIETLLVNKIQAAIEAQRQRDYRSVDRYEYTARLLQGGMLLDLGSTLRLGHRLQDVRGLGALIDSMGQPLLNSDYAPLNMGRDIFVNAIQDVLPFGSAVVSGVA